MNTIQYFGTQVANALDYVLGWLLLLPRDLTMLLLALGTTVLMTLARKWLTNQDLLGRCQADLNRLKELIQTARRAGDREAVQRLRTTQTTIRRKYQHRRATSLGSRLKKRVRNFQPRTR